MRERRQLQTQLEERLQTKFVSPTKYHELEGVLEQQENQFTERVDALEKELAEYGIMIHCIESN
jgi:hypothetical protein